LADSFRGAIDMTQLIAALISWCARMLFPSRGRHTLSLAAPTIPVTFARDWQPKTLRAAPQISPDEGAFVRPYMRLAELQGERRRQAERLATLAEAIGAPVRDWTVAARAAGIAA
jgi:hypothetical protein